MFKLFTKRKKFSKENLVHQCSLLEKNPKINPRNKQLVIETLRQIAELMIYGDQNDDSFFHLIAERNILGYFLSIVKQKYHRSVTIQVMQTLSIMIQNISKQQSLYYLFSNNYINDLVVHDFDFMDNEILAYYVSFLKTISLKLDDNVINFFFNAKAHDFPLYSEALKFFKNEDQMVRIAVRTLTLHVFGVDDTDLRKFITDKSAVPYFSNLTWFIRDQCIVLNETLNKAMYGHHSERKVDEKTPMNQLQRGVEEQVDHYYYLEDIFLLGLKPLSEKLTNQVLSHLVLPVLVGSLVDLDDLVKKQQDIESEYEREMKHQERPNYNYIEIEDLQKSTSNIEIGDDDTQKASAIRRFLERRTRISKQLSLFLLTQVLTVFSDGKLINAIIVALMHPSPPKLVNQIVLKPPEHAVECPIPIAEVIYGKKSLSTSSTPINEHNDEKKSNRSESMISILENDEQNKIQRSRINSVEKMNIIHEDSNVPEDCNIYRNELLNMLNSDPTQTQNEQLIASAAALILTLIRNESTSEELLITAGVCPQERKRKRQLLYILPENEVSPNSTMNDYPFEFVECIINVLSQCSKLSVFTIRVLSELLIDFVQDDSLKNNGLNDKHHSSLLSVWNGVKLRLSQYLPLESTAMKTYFIDTFEEEWRSVRQQPLIETLIGNAIRILPPHVFHANNGKQTYKYEETQHTNDTNDTNMKQDDQQQLIRKLERIRKSIHNLLHISRLKRELLDTVNRDSDSDNDNSVNLPFVPRTEFKYYYRLQVALSTIAPGCLNCLVLMQSTKRRRVLFSVREPDWLLLFNRMKGRAGFAMIYMAIPIHSIEGVVNKLDPRVVHLSIRSPVRPHDAAIPISSQKNKWSITLFFDSMFPVRHDHNGDGEAQHNKEAQVGHTDASTALDYIKLNRKRVRRKMMDRIAQLVGAKL